MSENFQKYMDWIHKGNLSADQISLIRSSMQQDSEQWEQFLAELPPESDLIPEEIMALYYEVLYESDEALQPSWLKVKMLWIQFQIKKWQQSFYLPSMRVVAMGTMALLLLLVTPLFLQDQSKKQKEYRFKGETIFAGDHINHEILLQQIKEGKAYLLNESKIRVTESVLFSINSRENGYLYLALIQKDHLELFFPGEESYLHNTSKNKIPIQTSKGMLAYQIEPSQVGQLSFCSFLLKKELSKMQVELEIKKLINNAKMPINRCQVLEIQP